MNNPINSDRHVYCDPDDFDACDDRSEEMMERADYLHDCRKVEAMERAMEEKKQQESQ